MKFTASPRAVCTVLIAFSVWSLSCQSNKEAVDDKPLTTFDQIASALEKAHGKATEVDTVNKPMLIKYALRFPTTKTDEFKAEINKTLNVLPVRSIETIQDLMGQIRLREYKWETPQYEVKLNANMHGKDTVNVMVWVRQ